MSSVKRIRQIPGQSLLSFGSLQRSPNEHKGERFCFDSFLSSNEPMANYGLANMVTIVQGHFSHFSQKPCVCFNRNAHQVRLVLNTLLGC